LSIFAGTGKRGLLRILLRGKRVSDTAHLARFGRINPGGAWRGRRTRLDQGQLFVVAALGVAK
jgi:hypothetical protein